ncbi:hypothetical protein CLM82_09410 [Streptomyces albidoflavus]|nr:hypothetical protein CLM82_09410 [Streptomyces albidoflavus]
MTSVPEPRHGGVRCRIASPANGRVQRTAATAPPRSPPTNAALFAPYRADSVAPRHPRLLAPADA